MPTVMSFRGHGDFEADGGPMQLAAHLELSEGELTYAWSWAGPGDPLREQSRATLRRSR